MAAARALERERERDGSLAVAVNFAREFCDSGGRRDSVGGTFGLRILPLFSNLAESCYCAFCVSRELVGICIL